MKQIKVYSADFEEIADICEDNNVIFNLTIYYHILNYLSSIFIIFYP